MLTLIDKVDNFEAVRDKIAQILANETANQQALAAAASLDPDPWKLRIYVERAHPYEQWLDDSGARNIDRDLSPIVSIAFDSSSFAMRSSNISERQTCEAAFNIDCFGYSPSVETDEGHVPGDEQAARNCQRAARLVRNILMSAEYRYLEMRGTVGERWIQNVNQFPPQRDGQTVQPIVGIRVTLSVKFLEFSPQPQPETLESVHIDINRAADGQLLAEAEYSYT